MEKNFEIGRYCVVYIDLMGHKRFLSELDKCANSAERQRRVNSISEPLYLFKRGVKKRVSETMRMVREQMKEKVDARDLASMLKMIDNISFGVQQFSDSTLIYVKMNSIASFVALLMIVEFVVFRMLDCVGNEVPLRGGISIGQGWVVDENCLCGKAIAEAYNLESKISDWGRITVSDSVVSELRELRSFCENTPRCNLGALVRPLWEVIGKDIDGVWFLDYLNPAVEELYKREHFDINWFAERIQRGKDFIDGKICEFSRLASSDLESARLALRYEIMREYWMSRIAMWGEHAERLKSVGDVLKVEGGGR